MKNLTNHIKKLSKKIEVVDCVNKLTKDQLTNYLNVNKDILSEDAIEVINWLIVNDKNVESELDINDSSKNILGDFYNAGKPSNKKLAILWDHINKLVVDDRYLEIPVFQTRKEFNDIVNMNIPLDYVVLRIGTTEGREKIPIRFEKLINKMIYQWVGKSNFTVEDLRSIAYEATVSAMNSFGKRGKRGKADDQAYINKTFAQHLAYQIRIFFLENIKNCSHLVKIPISVQRKEKEEKGTNTKSYSISGDKVVKKGKDGEGNKSIFDFIGMADSSGLNNLDNEDMDNLWKNALKKLEEKFNKTSMNIFYSFFGINGHEKMKNKDLAKKYDVVPSQITYYVHRIIMFIKKDATLKKMFTEINDLMHECLADRDRENKEDETYSINIKENNEFQSE